MRGLDRLIKCADGPHSGGSLLVFLFFARRSGLSALPRGKTRVFYFLVSLRRAGAVSFGAGGAGKKTVGVCRCAALVLLWLGESGGRQQKI